MEYDALWVEEVAQKLGALVFFRGPQLGSQQPHGG